MSAQADEVCFVPVPAGFVVDIEIEYDNNTNPQWLRVCNTEGCDEYREFLSWEGEQSGKVWSEGGLYLSAAVFGDNRNDCRVEVNAEDGYATVEFEDTPGLFADYNDVTVKLTPRQDACYLPVPDGWDIQLSIEYQRFGLYDQLVSIGTSLWEPDSLATFDSDDGAQQSQVLVNPGGFWVRGANFPLFGLPGDPESSKCQVTLNPPTSATVGFEGRDNDDYNDTILTLTRTN
jgi:hypothetical protein